MTNEEAVMTPQEAVKILKGAIKKPNTKDGYLGQAIAMAIKALEQTELNSSYNGVNTELDCISRTDALNAFKPKGISEELWMESNTYKVLTKLPSVKPQPNTEWIPCSDRLPEKDGEYLVYGKVVDENEDNHIFIGLYDEGSEGFGWWQDYYDNKTLGFLDSDFTEYASVVAWMPLPQPYKAESEDEE